MAETQKESGVASPETRAAAIKLPRPLQQRGPNAGIFLSWGGKIYGPATAEEIVSGLRTSWYEESTLYWHEGLEEWRPLREFSLAAEKSGDSGATTAAPQAPALPARAKRRAGQSETRRPRASRPRSRKIGRRGRTIVFGIALLAVVLTVGILLLLMLV